MKTIKLTGRERTVLRAIDFTNGTPGDELRVATKLESEDLADVLNGLIQVGYVEPVPYADAVATERLTEHTFEVNPSYALELRAAMRKSWA